MADAFSLGHALRRQHATQTVRACEAESMASAVALQKIWSDHGGMR